MSSVLHFNYLIKGIRSLLLLVMAAGLVACGPYHPLGISDDEWQTLSSEQRMQARSKQVEIDKAKAAERAEKARLRAEEQARQDALVAERRANPQFGERVQCVLSSAEAKISSKWREIEPIALDLVVGETVAFQAQHLRDGRTRYSRNGYASFDGQRVSLCRHENSSVQSSQCAGLLATSRQFDKGVSQKIDSPDFVRGQLRCDLVTPRDARHYLKLRQAN